MNKELFKIPIIIGVTGHRDIKIEDYDKLKISIRKIFDSLFSRYVSTSFILLSPLADGADGIIAQVALEEKYKDKINIKIPLPFDEELYISTFGKGIFEKDDETFINQSIKEYEDLKISDLDLYNNLSAISSRLKIFDESEIYFKKYFDLFDINSIEEVENINEFIYPFVKWYQALEILNEKDKLKELEQITNKNIQILKNKFLDKYDRQIEIEHNAYLDLKESEDSFDNQKYEIFYKLFINK